MIITLNSDGSYSKYKSYKKFLKHANLYTYALFNISTQLKGPVFTAVKNVNTLAVNQFIKLNEEGYPIQVQLDVLYDSDDTPTEDAIHLTENIEINSIEKFYSINPLIQQVSLFNEFSTYSLLNISSICIENVHLITNTMKGRCIIDALKDLEFDKMKDSLSMNTDVSQLFDEKMNRENKYMILKNNKWKTVEEKDIPNIFDYIGIDIFGTESFYLLSYEQYLLFSSIEKVNFEIIDRDMPDEKFKNYEIEPFDIEPYIMTAETTTIQDLLEICLLFPQLLLLEKTIYNVSNGLFIQVITKYKVYKLYISSVETSQGICLFEIINKLISM
jgi:hypothetical protein